MLYEGAVPAVVLMRIRVSLTVTPVPMRPKKESWELLKVSLTEIRVSDKTGRGQRVTDK